MKRLNIPAKYKGLSLHIWCSKCKKAVTKKPCKHDEQQRYQSRIYNPLTQTVNCIRSYDTRDVEEAITQHRAYHADLKANKFLIPTQVKTPESSQKAVFLKEGAKKYLDYLQDINVPEYEKKNLTLPYIKDQERYLMRFLKSVQKVEKKISGFPVTALSKVHVAAFDTFVREQNLSQTSYNAHLKTAKYFVNYLIEELDVEMKNPFEKVKFPEVHYDPEIIPIEEFEQLLSVITPEKGVGEKGKKRKEVVNYYRDWLKKVFVLALLTGERLDGIVLLKWSHIDGNFFKIPNFKVNRIKKVDNYFSYTPITQDLADLLLQFEITDEEDYIVVPEMANRATLKKFVSKAFTHYWRVAGLKRKVSFKNLRKTYMTRLTAVIGSKAMFVKHNDDKTAIKHYLKKKELLEATKDVRLYDISTWFLNTVS